VLRLRRYERISVQHRRFRGPVDPKFQIEGVAPPAILLLKTRLNNLSYGLKIWTDLSSVLSQCTRLTDRQTDRQLFVASPRWHSMQRGKKERMNNGR